MPDTEPLRIIELTGSRREIELSDRALPYRPVAWAGEQRIERTLYPGNPVATVQVLGPDETTLELHGRWKDRFIGQGMVTLTGWDDIIPQGTTPTVQDLGAVFHALRRSGNHLEVTWGPEVRRGVLTRFEVSWHRLDIAEWSMRFDWTSFGAGAPSPFSSVSSSRTSSAQDVTTRLSDFNDVMARMPSFTMPAIASLALGLGSSIASATIDLATAIAAVSGVSMVSTAQFQGVATYAAVVLDSCIELRQLVGLPPQGLVATDDVSSLLGGSVWARNATAALIALAVAAVEAREAIRTRAVPDFLADIRIREGQTLRDVATEYYGSPDAWTAIADANGLVGSVQAPGTRVFIPRREGRAA